MFLNCSFVSFGNSFSVNKSSVKSRLILNNCFKTAICKVVIIDIQFQQTNIVLLVVSIRAKCIPAVVPNCKSSRINMNKFLFSFVNAFTRTKIS